MARHTVGAQAMALLLAGLACYIGRPVSAQVSNATMDCVGPGCVGNGLDVCRGDVNLDGAVGVRDVLFVLAAFHGSDFRADVDGSGTVDIRDLLFILGGYDFAGCQLPSTPINALTSQAW